MPLGCVLVNPSIASCLAKHRVAYSGGEGLLLSPQHCTLLCRTQHVTAQSECDRSLNRCVPQWSCVIGMSILIMRSALTACVSSYIGSGCEVHRDRLGSWNHEIILWTFFAFSIIFYLSWEWRTSTDIYFKVRSITVENIFAGESGGNLPRMQPSWFSLSTVFPAS